MTTKSQIEVTCDGCGKTERISEEKAAPNGWFFVPLAPPGGIACCTVLACSEACKALPWKQEASS